MIENVARPKLVDELALAIDQFLTHQIERDTLACDLTQDELTELSTGLAAIAAMQPAQQWQGIESAPRDGTRFLASGRNGVRLVWLAYIDALNHPVWTDGDLDHYTLSHWMPLPTPPDSGKD